MLKSEKRLKQLASLLKSKNDPLINEGILLLREEQPFKGAIGLLTSFFNETNDSPVRKTIRQFMNDLKDQSATTEIMAEIKKQWKPETIAMLISSCWQSGLDYSAYSLDLVDVFLKGDYITALECFTIIEESANNLTIKRKNEIIKYIENNSFSLLNGKKTLAQELVSILSR